MNPYNAIRPSVIWSSNSESVAIVNSSNGITSGITVGKANIIVKTEDNLFADTLVLKVYQQFTDVSQIIENTSQLIVYPNPVKSGHELTISFSKAMKGIIEILDISGNVIGNAEVNNQSKVSLQTQKLSKGVYLINIKNSGIVPKKIIVE